MRRILIPFLMLAACAVGTEPEFEPTPEAVELPASEPVAEVSGEPRTLRRSETCRICPLSPRMIPMDDGGWLQPRRINGPGGGCRWVDDWIPLDEQEPCPDDLDTGL